MCKKPSFVYFTLKIYSYGLICVFFVYSPCMSNTFVVLTSVQYVANKYKSAQVFNMCQTWTW